jgi:hypothetical protein
MKRLRWVLALAAVTVFLLPPLPADAQERAPDRRPVSSLFDVRIGGFVQTNVTWDTDENQDDNPSSLREYAVVRDSRQHHQETLRWAATRMRLFIDVRGPELYGAKTRAYTEFDWDGLKLNDDGESSATAAHTPRLRHAYARFDWPNAFLTVGQTTLLINQAVSSSSSLEGVSSNHGDITAGSRNRSPQVILGAVIPAGPAKVELVGAVGRHATDQNPDDVVDNAQGLNDSGARSGLPALGALVKGTVPLFGRDAIFAASYYWGEATLTNTNAGTDRSFRDVNSEGVALEWLLPLPGIRGVAEFDFRGSVFQADNMSAWNLGHGGLTSTSPGSNPREITAYGGFAEANAALLKYYAVGLGYGHVEDQRDWVIKRGGNQRIWTNDAVWLFGQWRTGPVVVELLYAKIYTQRIDTASREVHPTQSDAVHVVFQYRF